jgi:medium-chain acyl-[acyl-carrier-protein] hydrolase
MSIMTKSSWFYVPRPVENPRLRLFCFPFAGGTAQLFREWPKGFPSDIEICAVQLPGRGARFHESNVRRMEPLLDLLTEAFKQHIERPFAFFGHSLGALVAFELTRRLRREHLALPQQLFLSGRRGPQLPHKEILHTLPDASFIATLNARYGGIPDVVLREPELLAIFLPALRADFEVFETWPYTPDLPLEMPITVLGGLSDAVTPRAELELWKEQTVGSFSSHLFAGGHFFFQSTQVELFKRLREALTCL